MFLSVLTCKAAPLTWARLASRAAAAPALPSGWSAGSQAMKLDRSLKESGCKDTMTTSHIRLDTYSKQIPHECALKIPPSPRA